MKQRIRTCIIGENNNWSINFFVHDQLIKFISTFSNALERIETHSRRCIRLRQNLVFTIFRRLWRSSLSPNRIYTSHLGAGRPRSTTFWQLDSSKTAIIGRLHLRTESKIERRSVFGIGLNFSRPSTEFFIVYLWVVVCVLRARHSESVMVVRSILNSIRFRKRV